MFGLPDERLGEKLATRVSLNPGAELSEEDLSSFLAAKIAKFKVPEYMWFQADELPKVAAGKIAKKQMRLYGGMVTFVVSGGLSQAKKVLENLEIFTLAESLGGAESLAEHPAIMTHASIPKETREALGIDDGLIRLSVGIETAEDLINDLKNALG